MVCDKMKFREPYKFEKNDEKGEEGVLLMEAAGKIEEDVSVGEDAPTEEEAGDEENVSVGEDALTEVEEIIEHELDESLPIINFTPCTNDELIEFKLDFFDLADEEELLKFFVIYFAVAAAEAKEEVEAAEIAAWAKETAWMGEVDEEDD